MAMRSMESATALPATHVPGGISGDYRIRRNVFHDYCPRSYDSPSTDINLLLHSRASSDMGACTDVNVASQLRSSCHMYMVPQNTVMLHDSTAVNDNVIPQRGSGVDYTSRE